MGEQGAESIHARMMKLERDFRGIKDELDSLKYIVSEQALYTAPSLADLRPPVKRRKKDDDSSDDASSGDDSSADVETAEDELEDMKKPSTHPGPPYWFSVPRDIATHFSNFYTLV